AARKSHTVVFIETTGHTILAFAPLIRCSRRCLNSAIPNAALGADLRDCRHATAVTSRGESLACMGAYGRYAQYPALPPAPLPQGPTHETHDPNCHTRQQRRTAFEGLRQA